MTSAVAARGDPATASVRSGDYRPGLDGLRAVAVVLVLLFHLDRLDGGNLGVDLFFAISGWLITWRLLGERDRTGTIALAHFWAARVRRLMPAALTVIVAVLVGWRLVGIDVPSLQRDALFATFWASNWGTISGGGDYWARFGEPSPLTHYWSLAIEEQFYLVWPLLVVGLLTILRRRPRAVVAGMAAVLAALSVVLMVTIYDQTNPTAAYMNTFTRAHSLLIGAVAGALTSVRARGDRPDALHGGAAARRAAPFAALVVVAMVAGSSKDSDWLFRWGFPLFAIAATVLVVAVADGLWGRVLAWGPMRWVGDRSYSIYLWHWPVILLLSADRFPTDGVLRDLARIVCSVVLADLSYRFVEQPIRRRRHLIGWRGSAATVAALGATTVLALVAPVTRAPSGEGSVVTLPPLPSTIEVVTTSVPASSPPTTPTPATIDSTSTVPSTSTTVTATSTTPPPPPPLRVLVTGDSTAVDLAEVLMDYSADRPDQILAGSAAVWGCGLSAFDDGRLHLMTDREGNQSWADLSECVENWDSIPRRVASDEQFEVVLVSLGSWDATDIRLADGTVVSLADDVGRDLVRSRYASFVAAVEAAGAQVVWITPPDVSLFWGTVVSPESDPGRWQVLRSIIDELPVGQVDLPGWLIANRLDGPEGRPDGLHLAAEVQERVVGDLVVPRLLELTGR